MLIGSTVQTPGTSPPSPVDSKALMAAHLEAVARDRCQQAYGALFRFFAPRIRSYAISQFGSEDVAMELVQETMTTVWLKAHLYHPQRGAPSTWIFTIARNLRFDMLRKQRKSKELVCAEDLWVMLCEQTPDSNQPQADEQVLQQHIDVLIEALPDKQRRVMHRIYVQGKSQQEVAEELNIPLGTVKSRTRLALAKLKEKLDD